MNSGLRVHELYGKTHALRGATVNAAAGEIVAVTGPGLVTNKPAEAGAAT
ncbi:hypothetical protein AB0M46_14100 [Dactylosporangium sp. NPDC051485]